MKKTVIRNTGITKKTGESIGQVDGTSDEKEELLKNSEPKDKEQTSKSIGKNMQRQKPGENTQVKTDQSKQDSLSEGHKSPMKNPDEPHSQAKSTKKSSSLVSRINNLAKLQHSKSQQKLNENIDDTDTAEAEKIAQQEIPNHDQQTMNVNIRYKQVASQAITNREKETPGNIPASTGQLSLSDIAASTGQLFLSDTADKKE